MNIEYTRFKQLATELGNASLARADAEAIVGIARLAVDADRRVDKDELAFYDIVTNHVCALAGLAAGALQDAEAKKPRGEDDRQTRMVARAAQLTTQPVRELAYAVAYMVLISDLDIQPVEDKFLDAMVKTFAISEDREATITSAVTDAVIPD
jgi:hypothetical protein